MLLFRRYKGQPDFVRNQSDFIDDDHVDPMADTYCSVSSDSDGLHKIKRVLAQRHLNKGREFLVQIKGEPAQNAIIKGTLFIFEC